MKLWHALKKGALIERVSRRFQQYFSHIMAIAHIIHVFSGYHQYYAGALKCLAQGYSRQKPRGSIAARTQDPWITSQTLYHLATQDSEKLS